MTKDDFLTELRSALSGNVSADVINENIRYYENYIDMGLRKGSGIEEVLEELGNPRLLAKTIIDTAPADERRIPNDREEEDAPSESRDNDYIMPWWMIVAVIFIVMIAIFILVNVAAVLIPVVIVLAIAFFVIKLFGRGR